MSAVLVDSNVILDLFLDDPHWAGWSEEALNRVGANNTLCIDPIIYTEVSIGFERIEELDEALAEGGFQFLSLPKEALFLTGKVFLQYRRNQGPKSTPLPDFFIGAHAAVMGIPLITRDPKRYRTYYPTVELIAPLTP